MNPPTKEPSSQGLYLKRQISDSKNTSQRILAHRKGNRESQTLLWAGRKQPHSRISSGAPRTPIPEWLGKWECVLLPCLPQTGGPSRPESGWCCKHDRLCTPPVASQMSRDPLLQCEQ